MELKTAYQVRAARALLNWTQAQLADISGVSVPTIKRIESSGNALITRGKVREDLERAFKGAGVVFTPENEKLLPGVAMERLHHPAYGTGITPSMISAIAALNEKFVDADIDLLASRIQEFLEKADHLGAEDPWNELERAILEDRFEVPHQQE